MHIVPHAAQRAQARQASQRFRTTLAEVYRDPVAARRTFNAQTERIGATAAAAEMGRHPARFGELRGTQVGPIKSAERVAALRAAPKLEHLGNEHVRRVREAWANRAEYREANTRVTRLERQIQRLDTQLERSPGRAHLERQLTRGLRRSGSCKRRNGGRWPVRYRSQTESWSQAQS